MKKIIIIIWIIIVSNIFLYSDDISYKDLGKAAVCTENLRLRSAQSTGSKTIMVMKKGDKVVIKNIGTGFSYNDIDSSWCLVTTKEDKTGWCFGGYLELGENFYADIELKELWSKEEGNNTLLSDDGKYTACINSDVKTSAELFLHNSETGSLLTKKDRYADVSYEGGTFSPDGKFLYFAGGDYLYSLNTDTFTMKKIGTPFSEYGYIKLISVGSDGNKIAVGYGGNHESIAVHDLSTGMWKHINAKMIFNPISVVLSPDDTYCIATVLNPGMIFAWRLSDSKIIWSRSGETGFLFCSLHNNKLISISQNLSIIDPLTGKAEKQFPLYYNDENGLRGVSYAMDKKIAALWNNTQYLYLYNFENGHIIGVLNFPGKQIRHASFDKMGTKLAVSFGDSYIGNRSSTVYSINIKIKDVKLSENTKNTETADMYSGFLTSHTFILEKDRFNSILTFSTDGRYYLSQMHSEPVSGAYAVYDNKAVLFEAEMDSKNSDFYESYIDDMVQLGVFNNKEGAVYKILPDYEDLFYKGAISGTDFLKSTARSDPDKTYQYKGVKCIKKSTIDKNLQRYILILNNLSMRKSPSINAELVHLGKTIDKGIIKDRTVVFKDEIYSVVAVSVKKDKINGIDAPWYLILVTDSEGPWANFEYVWVFGGYVKEIGYNEYKKM